MKSFAILAVAGVATAQGLGSCADLCISNMATIAQGPPYSCGADDISCFCTKSNWAYGIRDCSAQACDAVQAAAAVAYGYSRCQGFSASSSGPVAAIPIFTSALAGATGSVAGIVASITASGAGAANSAVSSAQSGASAALSSALSNASGAVSSAQSGASAAASSALSNASGAVQSAQSSASGALNSLTSAAASRVSSAIDAASSAAGGAPSSTAGAPVQTAMPVLAAAGAFAMYFL